MIVKANVGTDRSGSVDLFCYGDSSCHKNLGW